MDLPTEVLRLRLDRVAVDVSRCLDAADVPHVLLKGPSTSLWLYDPPRRYQDVDLLVPSSALQRATTALSQAGVAMQLAGTVGEEAPHSLLLTSTEGFEIDLHISLPTVPPSGDDVWNALAGHIEELDLGLGRVPVLDEAGRCLVLALHALNSGRDAVQPIDDLARARARSSAAVWDVAAALARTIGAEDLFLSGVALCAVGDESGLSRRARLYVNGAPNAAFGLHRLLTAPRRDLVGLLWRELMPTRGFMYHSNPDLPHTRRALATARFVRLRRLLGQVPAAVRAWRRARRPDVPIVGPTRGSR